MPPGRPLARSRVISPNVHLNPRMAPRCRWAGSVLLLASVALGLRLPSEAPALLTAAHGAPGSLSCSRHPAVALMAKKKKGGSKVSKAADKALAALEALEAQTTDGGVDALAPMAPEIVKKNKKKKKAAASAEEEDDPFAVPFADGMAPMTPEPLKKTKGKASKAAAPEAAAPSPLPPPAPQPAAAPMTMAEKVAAIGAELGVDADLPLAKAVAAANEAMGLEADGTMAEQVATLMAQLGIEDAAEPAPVAPPPPVAPPVAATPPPAPTEAVAVEAEETARVEAEGAAVAEAGEEDEAVESAPREVTLSKKKQGKKKQQQPADGEAAEATGSDGSTDQSGRRAMGTKRIETFADAPPGFAYVKLNNGQLRFRQQDVLRGVTWDAQTGQRVGLVGNNGAGKTTQLRVLAEELELDGGELIKSSPEIKVSFLRQEFREDLREGRTLKEEVRRRHNDTAAQPCHAMPCHAMPCHAMPCHAMPARLGPARPGAVRPRRSA